MRARGRAFEEFITCGPATLSPSNGVTGPPPRPKQTSSPMGDGLRHRRHAPIRRRVTLHSAARRRASANSRTNCWRCSGVQSTMYAASSSATDDGSVRWHSTTTRAKSCVYRPTSLLRLTRSWGTISMSPSVLPSRTCTGRTNASSSTSAPTKVGRRVHTRRRVDHLQGDHFLVKRYDKTRQLRRQASRPDRDLRPGAMSPEAQLSRPSPVCRRSGERRERGPGATSGPQPRWRVRQGPAGGGQGPALGG